jgi:HEAT repeat protein
VDQKRELENRLLDSDEEIRLQALKELSRRGVGDVLPALFRALGDTGWRVRKEAVEIFLGLPAAASLCGEVCELLHSQENAGLRNAAVEILTRIGRAALPGLLEELTCQDHDVRKFALDILGAIGDPSAAAGMIRALVDEDGNVRAAAAENLGRLRVAEAVPALLDVLEQADLLLRFTVLESLGQIGQVVPVTRLLTLEHDPLVRKALFDCLGRVGGLEAVPRLVDGLGDEMSNVREAAALALCEIAADSDAAFWSQLRELAGADHADALIELLASPGTAVRKAALTLLGGCGDARHARRLLACFDEEELRDTAVWALANLDQSAACSLTELWPGADARTRTSLAYVIGSSGCRPANDLLIEGLASGDPGLRLMSARSLGLLGEIASLEPLVAALRGADEELREVASQALCRLAPGCPDAVVPALRPLLEEEAPALRAAAVTILGNCDGSEVKKILQFALKDDAVAVRRAAVRAIEGRPGEDQAASLRLALTDEDNDVRRLAAEALAGGGQGALGALELALQDEDLWVRAAAVRSLGRIDGEAALELVENALGDGVGLVAIAALETLGELNPAGVRARAVSALSHGDEEVVIAAIHLLASSGSCDWLEGRGEELLNHRHWEVRLIAARAIAGLLGPTCAGQLESRLLVEGEELVRQELQDLLIDLRVGEG